MSFVFAVLAGQALLASAPTPNPAAFNPNANELFDRDPQLRGWAVRQFDRNGDGWLTLYEAQPAIAAFREIADGDSDGRITVMEFRRAKEFIAARW
jgi:hypothetical protein